MFPRGKTKNFFKKTGPHAKAKAKQPPPGFRGAKGAPQALKGGEISKKGKRGPNHPGGQAKEEGEKFFGRFGAKRLYQKETTPVNFGGVKPKLVWAPHPKNGGNKNGRSGAKKG